MIDIRKYPSVNFVDSSPLFAYAKEGSLWLAQTVASPVQGEVSAVWLTEGLFETIYTYRYIHI